MNWDELKKQGKDAPPGVYKGLPESGSKTLKVEPPKLSVPIFESIYNDAVRKGRMWIWTLFGVNVSLCLMNLIFFAMLDWGLINLLAAVISAAAATYMKWCLDHSNWLQYK